ncbi:uncharacterized protein LACBIDRAFT_334394 [Laccaria bicolor S238N-H82]|uniref:Predicted protein n=1 Tax=Laccaria bicolor (strain S238N-H82 / ATCC MYA-4686) TaxID=486041 RepID=B0DZ29_LACBS|nr:uncharacterized protein LACBIDRAFT_334394 [Laccaria bicolor S238N-H82]EDR00120.1 predicted protein [Laccaria bicolor S238N-H82]|eukprot:XP_001889177.1 predicted protein [Laccaria bicolor S238N-H82]
MADEKNYLAVPRQEHHRNPSSPTSTVDAESANPLKGENIAAKDNVERAGPNTAASCWRYLNEDVDTAQTTSQLALCYFMTGYIGVISFSAIFVWCGFQTARGNFAQHGPSGSRDTSFHKADQQALTSLISFNAGAFIGRIGDRVGAHKRIWLIAGTFIQAVLTMAAAIAFWKSGQPSISNARDDPAWTNVATFVGLAFMSASLGVQGILAKRLNTQFGTTIVLTTVWVELVSDPRLFSLRQRVISRDHRVIAAVALFIGSFVSRAILQKIGTAGTLGVAVGIKIFIVPTKRGQKRNTPAE